MANHKDRLKELLGKIAVTTNTITVEDDISHYTILELVNALRSNVTEINKVLDSIDKEVKEEVQRLIDDGTLERLINDELLGDINAQLSDVNEKTSDFTYSYSVSKNKDYLWVWFGIEQINFIGDSITHGANASDLDSESWAGIIKSSLLNKYGSENQGFEKLFLSMSNEAQSKMDGFHKVENYNFNVIYDGSNIAQSKYVGVEGASLIITPKCSSKFQIVYQGLLTDGTFTIRTNENYTTPITINTKVPSNDGLPYYATEFYVNKGDSIIIEVINGTVELLGVLYYQDRSDLFVNNYGRSGAKLTEVSDEVLQMWSQSALSFFALGHNDSFFPDTIDVFRDKISKMISYYKQSKCYVVVLDFLWTLPKDNPFRMELQRMASELDMPYISFTEELYGSGSSKKWIDGGFLSDSSHPSVRGHQIIADVISQRLSLGLKSFESTFNKIAYLKNNSTKTTNVVIEQNHDVVSGFIEVIGSRDALVSNNKLITLMSGLPTKDISFYGFAVGKKSSKTVYEVIGFSINPKGEVFVWGTDSFDTSTDITLQVNVKYSL